MNSRDKEKAPSTKFEFDQQELTRGASMKEKRSASIEKESETDKSESAKADVSAATFLDVAVLRCLFISHWQEEGIFWSLQYLYNRYVGCSFNISVGAVACFADSAKSARMQPSH